MPHSFLTSMFCLTTACSCKNSCTTMSMNFHYQHSITCNTEYILNINKRWQHMFNHDLDNHKMQDNTAPMPLGLWQSVSVHEQLILEFFYPWEEGYLMVCQNTSVSSQVSSLSHSSLLCEHTTLSSHHSTHSNSPFDSFSLSEWLLPLSLQMTTLRDDRATSFLSD